MTCLDVSCSLQIQLYVSKCERSCADSQAMNSLYFITSGEVVLVPSLGACSLLSRCSVSSLIIIRTVFTVLRVFAILQGYSWRPVATWILATLACAAFALSSVRSSSLGRTQSLSDDPGHQYADFTSVWVYVSDPVLGSSCFQATPPAAVGIVNRCAISASDHGRRHTYNL